MEQKAANLWSSINLFYRGVLTSLFQFYNKYACQGLCHVINVNIIHNILSLLSSSVQTGIFNLKVEKMSNFTSEKYNRAFLEFRIYHFLVLEY